MGHEKKSRIGELLKCKFDIQTPKEAPILSITVHIPLMIELIEK